MLALPPRPKEFVPVVVDGPLAAVSFRWQLRPPQDTLVVAIRATFSITPDAVVATMAEPLLPVGDLHFDDDVSASVRYASDYAPFKPKADVTLVGHAYPSADRHGFGHVQLVFGSVRAAVAAIGDRTWKKGAPSDPKVFDAMPLRWERAFGGNGYKANPLGQGYDGDALPNLEDPKHLIRSPGDRPKPQCLAPVPREFAERHDKLGTYDKQWLEERWPYFPRDVDWSYFNAAPSAQQIPYPRGDETFELAGVHPDHPVLSGRLAGISARAFAQRTAEAGAKFHEIPVNLDTVAFDADALEVSLVWRGLMDVADEYASEVERLFVCADSLDTPRSIEVAQAAFVTQLVELHGADVVREDADPPVADGSASDAPPPSIIGPSGSIIPTAPVPDDAVDARPDDRSSETAVEPSELPEQVPAPVISRQAALDLIASGSPLEGLNFARCDLVDADLSGRSLKGTVLSDAILDGANFAEADLSQAVLVRAQASAASFKGAKLCGANLAEAQLSAADFEGASLEDASLAEISASGVNLATANLCRAKLNDANLESACFDGAAASQADFSGATLTDASFAEATLDDAQLYDCEALGAKFQGASLARIRADGAKLVAANFDQSKAAEASFTAADLTDAEFTRADITRAILSHAQAQGAKLTQATACGAAFRHADLAGLQAPQANLMEANFEGADLSGADLRGANLYAAETWKAKLAGAKLEQALVAGSKLAT